jgi:hypothetical protein
MEQDSPVSTVRGYGLDRWDSIPGRGKIFSLLHSIQTDSRTHLASYLMGTEGSFSKGKVARAMKLTVSLHIVPRSKIVELYLHSFICLNSMLLN